MNVSSFSFASYVNLIVGCILFMKEMHCLICSFVNLVSSSPMKRFTYAGAIFVPMAVPCSLFLRTRFANSAIISGLGCSGCLKESDLSLRKSFLMRDVCV